VHRHDRVATIGLLVAGALTLPIAMKAVSPELLLPLLALAGAAGGATGPSRDMIVRSATPPGASGKVFGFVYSGLDLGATLTPALIGSLLDAGRPRALFVAVAAVMAASILTATTIPSRRGPGAAPARA
jgi:FSR family fosmidomycin resistance protein-like MFS transporter